MKKLSHSFAKVSHSYKKGVALVGIDIIVGDMV